MLFRRYQRGDERRIDLVQPRVIDRLLPLAGLAERYFRYDVRGLGNVPEEGPGLLAMNHGPVPVDALLLGARIYRHQRRLVRALTDHLVFDLPGMRELFLALGAVDGRM